MSLDLGLAARVVSGIRTETARRTGCKEWDAPGVAKALQSTEGPPGAVLAAACIAAEDPTLEKPSSTAFRARWHSKAVEPPRQRHDIPCPDHIGEVQPCRRCKAETRPPAPEEMARLREIAEAAKKRTDEQHREAEEVWLANLKAREARAEVRRQHRIEETCCGACPGSTCYVDGVTGA